MPLGKLLEALRDRVVHRSQIGKRRLDRSVTRRELDDAQRHLGERLTALVRSGRLAAPAELETKLDAVRGLEERLAKQDAEIAELEGEHPSRGT